MCENKAGCNSNHLKMQFIIKHFKRWLTHTLHNFNTYIETKYI